MPLPPIRTVIVVERTSEHDWRAEYINFPDPEEQDQAVSVTVVRGHTPQEPGQGVRLPPVGDWSVTCKRLGEA